MASSTHSPNTASSTSGASETSDSSSGFTSSTFGGNAPSTVLFFLALAVGVFIAFLFVFFTVRYFVRSHFGLHVYPLTRRHNNILVGGTTQTASHVELTDDELQEHIEYIRSHHFIRGEILERRLLGRNRRRRRRGGRYSRMKKLTEQEVEILFPKKTYHDWLNGGQERDSEIRNGALQEEGDLMNHKIEDMSDVDEIEINAAAETTLHATQTHTSQYSDARTTPSGPTDEIEMRKLDAQSSASGCSDEAQGLHFTSGTCAICLEVLENDDIVRGLLCGHVYHAECLDPWLTKRRACCPTCKRDYFFKAESGITSGNATEAETTANEGTIRNSAGAEGHGEPGTDSPASSPDVATSPTTDHADTNEDEDFTLDLDMLRNDPTLRAMIQELVPTSERVRLILADSRNAHYNLEQRAKVLAKKKYGNFLKKFLWRIMGISREDLYNWAVITLYHESRGVEQSANISSEVPNDIRRPEPAAQSDAQRNNGPTDTIYSERDVVEQRV
ncbi:hypothetical protein PGUG_00900 [Meyerozyma guilliermondii ATCC 6260]|uniref:RING-type domain-containing protein n=1 Tax=Meyerozyma guilliermondii (strain ATCC 6260 / CBS 566 / DSM 6381 / JCM 1539 / NBRC 10279 / NRRL Y-324) TaxID=294746 RepID=A5DC95_PICGU|nr:uncharacterized protein PGUG_00900 [Meyerozyma guilliermondii ATCC 6260]EDK36802.2 hypothetical protein PGUG_00900 [Meyerozyma guilliermondii ATCC 6260]